MARVRRKCICAPVRHGGDTARGSRTGTAMVAFALQLTRSQESACSRFSL